MGLALVILLFVVGLILIVKGGDEFVDAAAWMAEASGIPKFLIGATVVSFATTLPELLVSLLAVINGKTELAVGNAVGSVTANTGLILGIALICMPTAIKRMQYLPKALMMLGAAAIIVVAGLGGGVGVVPSVLLLAIFAASVYENVRGARLGMLAIDSEEEGNTRPRPARREIIINIAKFVLGAAGIVLGAQLLVDNGSELARLIGVPERIIGVTIIAVGTSLPELVTTITAIAKKQASLSIGNVIGANIIDLTLILPICAVATGSTLPISTDSGFIDLPACLLVGMVALVPTLITGKFTRVQGGVLLAIYAVYVALTTGIIAL